MLKNIILGCTVIISTIVFGQHQCGHDDLQSALYEQNPKLLEKNEEQNTLIKELVYANKARGYKTTDEVLTIPVVVHIVHNTAAGPGVGEYMTDAEIIAVINEVNDNFAHTSGTTYGNPFSGTDLKIKLSLAVRDTSGKPTTGIIRHPDNDLAITNRDNQITQTTYNWRTTDYLNLYVVDTITSTDSYPNQSGVYGYAYKPSSHGLSYDGGVFRADAFWHGLLCHEIGHYFGLDHNFLEACLNDDCTTDGDKVCDTPPKTSAGGHSYDAGNCIPSDNCDADDDDLSINNPFRPIANGGSGNIDDSNENYMDYSGGCWSAFTAGQKERMRTFITTTRASLLTSSGAREYEGNDITVLETRNPINKICSSPYSPLVSVLNFGLDTIRTAEIDVYINDALHHTYSYSGLLYSGCSEEITLNSITYASGENSIKLITKSVNGTVDSNNDNDTLTYTIELFDYVVNQVYPYSQNFESSFETTDWSIINRENDDTWTSTTEASGFGVGDQSIMIDNYNTDLRGKDNDQLISPIMDLSNISDGKLIFDVAYAGYNSNNYDQLDVSISSDCGASWNQVYSKGLDVLGTTSNTTLEFTPTPSQWRKDTINLSAYAGQEILIGFENVADWGNRIFLDNMLVESELITGVSENTIKTIPSSIFPNPTNDDATLKFYSDYSGEDITVSIVNSLGTEVQNYTFRTINGDNLFSINSDQLFAGIYIVSITGESFISSLQFNKL